MGCSCATCLAARASVTTYIIATTKDGQVPSNGMDARPGWLHINYDAALKYNKYEPNW